MNDLYVVTGASRGLGAALAQALRAREGVTLVTLARADADVVADLGSEDGIHAACAGLERVIRGVACAKAVLVNNAGVVQPVGPLEACDPHELARNVAVNLTAPLLLTRAFLRATRAAALRRVINISSGAARRPIEGWGAYCATKAGLDMATRVLADEARGRGERIEVASVAPGVVDTGMQAVVRGASAERFPDVERFRKMKEEGVLRPAPDVARDILAAEASGALFREVLGDLRTLA